MPLKATAVFTPGAFPEHTYVERYNQRLEQSLVDALDTPGQLISLAGPSKSGKTVLVERVVGDNLISISGVGIRQPEDIWSKVLAWMGTPASVTSAEQNGREVGAAVSATGKVDVMFVASGSASANGSIKAASARTITETRIRDGLAQVTKEIANSGYVILVDDFHYMPRDVQVEAAKALKEAVRLNIKVCTAAVLHRGDDILRANPELRGRVRSVDLEYWSIDDLKRIAVAGFERLNIEIEEDALAKLAIEAAGSPQLMQQICLHVCFVIDVRESLSTRKRYRLSDDLLKKVFEQVSSTTDFRSLVDVLDLGPKTRGTERKLYQFHDGSSGDVYRCVLKAVAANPPSLSFPYEDLTKRTQVICKSESPVGSSVTGTCVHMTKLAEDKFPSERVVEWDEQKQILDIPDPYFLFYLRWSERLMQSE
jgi:hypothetical protein